MTTSSQALLEVFKEATLMEYRAQIEFIDRGEGAEPVSPYRIARDTSAAELRARAKLAGRAWAAAYDREERDRVAAARREGRAAAE